MAQEGYSGTPLAKKLGVKAGMAIRLVNAPSHYRTLFDVWPEAIEESDDPERRKDFIHLFAEDAASLAGQLRGLKGELKPAAALWVSWPKKSAKTHHKIGEAEVRAAALAVGLVDVKVCAVDTTWSALKLVIPVKDRRGR